MKTKVAEELERMLVDEWQKGVTSGMELIAMTFDKLSIENPNGALTYKQVSDLISTLKLPCKDNNND